MSAVIPLASRSQSTFPRLVFVPRRCARACFLREYCTCRVLAPINGHSRFPFTPRERRNARIGEMVSRRVSIVLSLPITSEIIKLRTTRLIQAPYIGKRRARGFVEDAETSERRLPPTHDISRLPDEEPCEETPRGSSSEITGNREEID